jgi:hypothetical protein
MFHDQQHMNRRVLVDENEEQSVQRLFGGRDSEIIVVDTAGNIALKQPFADTNELEEFLKEHCD